MLSPRQLEAAFHGERKRKRAPKTVLKLPDLEQSKSAVMNRPDVGEFKALLRSCDSRIHRLVVLRASTCLQ
jgi:hypothetical protein